MSIRLNVVSGRGRTVVGSMEARTGMLTSEGRILKVNTSSIRVLEETGAESNLSKLEGVTVRLSEARRLGYPDAENCVEITHVPVKRRAPRQEAVPA